MELARIPWTAPAAPDAAELRRVLEDEGFSVWSWTDRPGTRYGAHSHDHDESIWVVAGDITFGLAGTDHPLRAGDRLMLPRDTVHTAVVGVDGATYLIGER